MQKNIDNYSFTKVKIKIGGIHISGTAQRSELQSQIWKIANDVRGSVDGWDFKQCVLGTLFYCFISENFINYIEGGDDSVNYAGMDDKIITKEIVEDAVKTKGYFIYPTQLFCNIAKLAIYGQATIKKIYDPAAGSGSLLLQAKKQFDNHIIEDGFYGQEINHTTYNLARINMFLHNVNYDKFNIALGNILLEPHFGDEKPFDAIVSNPTYSINWIGSDDPTLINDERFVPAGILAPKSKADFAFILHSLSYLSSRGRAAIVCFPGIFYRGGAEQKIRKYLVDNNFIETIIALAPNLFYGTSIAVNILVLSKHKTDTKIHFIGANAEEFYKKETNNNVLTSDHIEEFIRIFADKEDREYVSKSVDNDKIAAENYNLSVSFYVEAKDIREKIDIVKLNAEIKKIACANKCSGMRLIKSLPKSRWNDGKG